MQNHPSRATDHLLSKMWKTKSSRFNAHARLRARRHRRLERRQPSGQVG